MASNGISTLSTKELRQKAKLALAAIKRAATGRRAYYDITELPTQYSGNTVVDNPNVGGLVQGRPWLASPPGFPINWYGTTTTIEPTGPYTMSGAGFDLPLGTYLNVGQNLQGTTFTITVDVDLNSSGGPWIVLWGNESYSGQSGYVMYWQNLTSAYLGIFQGRFGGGTTPDIHSAGRAVYTSVVDGLNVTFYKDGAVVGGGTMTLSGSPTTIPNNNFYFGARHGNSGTGVADAKGGTYYSAIVHGTALTAQQVLDEYNAIHATW